MANPDLSLLSDAFVEHGGTILMERVNAFDAANRGILVFKNVKKPQAIPKVSAVGNPRPYRKDDDFTGNGVQWSDRTLTVNASKWDMQFDFEQYRNKYLAKNEKMPYYQYCIDTVAEAYLAAINDEVAGLGVFDAAGDAAVDMADGWLTIIAGLITDGDLTPVTQNAITASNAVTEIEKVVSALPHWMRQKGFRVKVSYAVFDFYCKHYRALNTFKFEPDAEGRYKLDNVNGYLEAESWMGTSQRTIAVVDDVLCMGTDGDSVTVDATPHLDLMECRFKMPIGFQVGDLNAIVVGSRS